MSIYATDRIDISSIRSYNGPVGCGCLLSTHLSKRPKATWQILIAMTRNFGPQSTNLLLDAALVYGTMDLYTLLLVARSQSLAGHLRSALPEEQYLIRWVPSVAQAFKLDLRPSLLILDLPPSGGARSTARLKRRFGVPLLAISKGVHPIPDEVDAYLSRPCSAEEIAALTEATLMAHSPHMVRVGGMSLDTRARRLQVNGSLYRLRPIGCRILALLMSRAGSVVYRDELFHRVWQIDDRDNTRALDVHIAHLRRTLEPDPRNPQLIVTERGLGYRLQPPV